MHSGRSNVLFKQLLQNDTQHNQRNSSLFQRLAFNKLYASKKCFTQCTQRKISTNTYTRMSYTRMACTRIAIKRSKFWFPTASQQFHRLLWFHRLKGCYDPSSRNDPQCVLLLYKLLYNVRCAAIQES